MARRLLSLLCASLLTACMQPLDMDGDDGDDATTDTETADPGSPEVRDGGFSHATGTIPSAIDGWNDPEVLVPDAVRVFDALPLDGALPVEPWSGSYWPEHQGGIAYRWRTGESFVNDHMSRAQAIDAHPDEIDALSPAEKYDLYAGNYGWSLTKRLLSETHPDEASWTGYCHGWAPASAAYEEPAPVTVVNPDGIEITFGSSDVKALLSYYRGSVVTSTFAAHDWARQARVSGSVCGSANPADPACHDTNPGTFHIVMANKLGLEGQHFLFDVDPTVQKWNQPAWGYASTVLESREPARYASEGTATELLVRTELEYTIEIEPTHGTVVGSPRQHSRTLVVHYTLDLDAEGRILGGQWQAPLEDGAFASLDEVWSYLMSADEDHDGEPDFTEDEARDVVWENFRFPDYLWLQDDPEWSDTHAHLRTGWELIATTGSSRQLMYEYFSLVPDLL